MIRINSPRGLGDAIHLRAIVRHLLSIGHEVTVFTRWPEMFGDLPVTVHAADEAIEYRDLISARACFQCRVPQVREMSQFANACLQAGIDQPIDLDIGWAVRNAPLLKDITGRAAGRPILVFQPLKHVSNSNEELLRPDNDAFRALIGSHRDHFKVRVGHPRFVDDDHALPGDLDLVGKTSVTDAIDLVTICDLVCCEPSFLGIAAQAFDKKVICLFSSRALRSTVIKVAGVTPARVFHKPHLSTAVYDGS